MTDIVERLKRVGAERQRTTAHDDPDHYLHVVAKISNADGTLMQQAATEIERLRADSQKAALDYLGQVGQLSDEITRLRAALLEIEGMIPHAIPNYTHRVWAIARAAIAVALEEAAQVADAKAITPDAACEIKARSIAAAIREMIPKEKGDE